MSDEQPWERMEGEPNNWYARFMLYLQAGPSRTLLGTINAEQVQKGAKKFTSISQSWSDAAKRWKWKERAEAYDEHRRREVFTSGNASDLVRIEKLDSLSVRLEAQITRMLDNLESPEMQEAAKKKPWFNHFLYEKYLQSLEALAAETGGRVKKAELTMKDLPKVYVDLDQDEDGVEP